MPLAAAAPRLCCPAAPSSTGAAAFFEARFSPGVGDGGGGGAGRLHLAGLFAFKHVEYCDELWWRFALQADAPRFLRASVGATAGAARLRRRPPAPPGAAGAHRRPPPAELERRGADHRDAATPRCPSSPSCATRRCSSTSRARASSCTGCRGGAGSRWESRSARRPMRRDLIRQLPGARGRTTARSAGLLPAPAASGCTSTRTGAHLRQARRGGAGALAEFSLDGAARKPLRLAVNRCEQDGAELPRGAGRRRCRTACPRCARLRRLAGGEAAPAEKGFSLGFFDADYLRRFPLAVLERGGASSVAFAQPLARTRQRGALRRPHALRRCGAPAR